MTLAILEVVQRTRLLLELVVRLGEQDERLQVLLGLNQDLGLFVQKHGSGQAPRVLLGDFDGPSVLVSQLEFVRI